MSVVNKIIGVCRFSYLGLGGFRINEAGAEEAAKALYAADRMTLRFAYFETICLPSLAAQTDSDFTFVALIADTMPLPFRQRLKRLTETYPFLRIAVLESTGPYNSTRRAFSRGLDGQETDFITGFRLDDDDAVSVDYIARTREAADTLITLGWATKDDPAAVCFHRGIYWDMKRPDAPFWDYSEIQPLGLASAMVHHRDSRQNIYRWNHRKLASKVRCWTDPSDVMFLRTLHDHNDSGRVMPRDAEQIPDEQARRLLKDRFGLNPKRLLSTMDRVHGGTDAARQWAAETREDPFGKDGDA
ncbi:putative rhamnosyl transferase [Jannaschia sp. CCS1]|uniref:putative rhamnosyl transferase n=1 Tax=Jannaschia sp. (strain CCS1) TaxID=290400 RepID=UPI000053AF18|nr:putative rhamnosyl transferase [Jannaschia sp. CCS1]ABD53489.1 hypothetical protein Jann_0572 [Jannaschia sp. CCS1]